MALLKEVDDKQSEISDEELSECSSDEETESEDEGLLSRIYALRDIVPPETRAKIANTTTTVFSKSFDLLKTIGNGAWILVTGAAIVALPAVLEIEREQAAINQEVQKAQQQQIRQQQLLAAQDEEES